MIEDGSVVRLGRDELQSLLQSDTEIGTYLMRAFISRNLDALDQDLGGQVLLGSRNSLDTLRVHDLLTRNAMPFRFIDLDRDAEAQAFLESLSIVEEDIPVLLCGENRILRNPANERVAACLGWNINVDAKELRDVVVVGAGPAGLSATVYAGSEGLDTLLLETKAPGGQAGSSSRIENYLGFPNGISGLELASRAFDQVRKFGADALITQSATGLDARPDHLQFIQAKASYAAGPSLSLPEHAIVSCRWPTSNVTRERASSTRLQRMKRNCAAKPQ